MKIAVVGAGVVGLAAAHELCNRGHEVTVFDKNGAAGEGSTFANGGICSQSYALPFSGVGVSVNHLSRFSQLTRKITRLRKGSLPDLRWLWQAASHGSEETATSRIRFAQQLIQSSIEINDAAIKDGMLELEQSDGQLILLRNDEELNTIHRVLNSMNALEMPFQVLEASELEVAEPSLQNHGHIRKAIRLPTDRVMNCRQFVLAIKQQFTQAGGKLAFQSEVTELVAGAQPMVRLASGEQHVFDHVVLCTSTARNKITLRTPALSAIAELSAYALSVGIREPLNAPKSAVQDHKTGITISRLGKRLRVCGGAELNRGSAGDHDKRVIARLFNALDQYFPGAANYAGGSQVWRGSCGYTPDGLPLVGNAGAPGLWINLGHGANGWGMASGSARLLCEQIEGRPASLSGDFLHPLRFNR